MSDDTATETQKTIECFADLVEAIVGEFHHQLAIGANIRVENARLKADLAEAVALIRNVREPKSAYQEMAFRDVLDNFLRRHKED